MGRRRLGSSAQLEEECIQFAALQMVASCSCHNRCRNLSTGAVGRHRLRSGNCEGWICCCHLLDRLAELAYGASVRTVALVLLNAPSIDAHVHVYVAELSCELAGPWGSRVA